MRKERERAQQKRQRERRARKRKRFFLRALSQSTLKGYYSVNLGKSLLVALSFVTLWMLRPIHVYTWRDKGEKKKKKR